MFHPCCALHNVDGIFSLLRSHLCFKQLRYLKTCEDAPWLYIWCLFVQEAPNSVGAIQCEVQCRRKIKGESCATSSYYIVRRSQEQRNRQEDPPLPVVTGDDKICHQHFQRRPGQSSQRPPRFGVRYWVTPSCFSVGTDVYNAQHIYSITKHIS